MSLTSNLVDFTIEAIDFEYSRFEVHSIHPSSGPTVGGSLVTIVGAHFGDTASTICSFGNAVSAAFILNFTQLQCIAPPQSIGTVRLTIGRANCSSMPGMTWSFRYFDTQLDSILPASGPVLGGTNVIVRGLGFAPESTMLCKFGMTLGPANFVNETAVRCVSPHHYPAIVPLELSLNGQDFTASGMQFSYSLLQILRLQPSSGSPLGGTMVFIWARGIRCMEVDIPIFCAFGMLDVVPGRCAGPELVQCISPPHPNGTVELELYVPSLGNSSSQAQFIFAHLPEIYGLHPNNTLHETNTPVVVRGTGFVNSSSLSCKFGDVTTNATFLNDTLLVCTTPRMLIDTIDVHGTVSMEVSVNGQDFSRSGQTFSFTQCPRGALCIHNQKLPCPPGAACNGISDYNVSLCPVGTYAPRAGASSCDACIEGTFCPEAGMRKPLPCAPGMVCSRRGLAYPNALCPPGHFCLQGTASATPHDPAERRHPIECPENTWCPAGVVTNVSTPGNMSSPQPCLLGFVCYRGSATPMGSGPCPTGYYCPPQSLPVECPVASYCPNVGNIFPSLCSPGFFNDQRAASECKDCPIGYYCPEYGLELPIACPEGSVCSVPGRQMPSAQCPPGYHCWQGTETEDWNAETQFKPIACPEATYCIGGIRTNITNEEDYNSPQPCPHGQFCKEASTTPFGTGRCPAGFFCPRGTSDPYPAPAGYFCLGEGNSQAAPCLSGTWNKFNPINGTDRCQPCPGGYSCEREGTYEPLPCLPGMYRQFNATVSCQMCPEGKWNPYYANPLEDLCLPCPESRVCPLKGMINVTRQSDPCPPGYMCSINTTSSSKFNVPCPAGYWCDRETKPSDMGCSSNSVLQAQREATEALMTSASDPICHDNALDPTRSFLTKVERSDGRRCFCPVGLCPAGFICYEGTKAEERNRNLCFEGHYCPEGTTPESLQITVCPEGTRSPQGSSERRQCVRTSSRPTIGITTRLIKVAAGTELATSAIT
eukprot:7387368-Prymnesium_polylepis.1